jgi:outer membrane protein OmpA-like peptidoglycan-associated protein
MRRFLVSAALLTFAASSLRAQQTIAFEAGLFAQFTNFADTTHVKSNIGGGARFGIFLLPRISLEYEASVIPTHTQTQSSINVWNNRIDAVYNAPLSRKTILLIGAGFTGTNYKGDTTHNAYDGGWNVMLGIRQCMNTAWSWRADVVDDFKDPADQTPKPGAATQTFSVRLGVSWFLGKHARFSPCKPEYVAPAPPAPAYVAPAPAPAPPPPPPPAPVVTPAPAPAPPPAPAPARARELFTLKAVLFEFDKSTLTKGAKDTLQVAVRYLNDHPDVRVEIQGNTDSKGSDEYNMKLGMRRAESVKAYLGTQGVNTDRVSTRSFGESQPVADNQINGKDNPAGRALNRRVVIIELP